MISVSRPASMQRSRRHRLMALATAALFTLTTPACGGQTVQMSDQFWLRAPGPALIQLSPPSPLGAPGVLVKRRIDGTVTRHSSSGRAGIDYRLTLETRGGKSVEISYRLGGRRRLPVESGNLLRVDLFLRRHVTDDGHDRGMLVYRIETDATVDPDGRTSLPERRPPDAKLTIRTPVMPARPGARGVPPIRVRHEPVLIAAVDQNHVLEDEHLPAALRALRATDVAAYQESGRFEGDCAHVREQRYVRLTQPNLLIKSEAKILNGKLFAPGSRLLLRDTATEDLDLMLLSNLEVTRSRSHCRDHPDTTWAWAAIRVPHVEAPTP